MPTTGSKARAKPKRTRKPRDKSAAAKAAATATNKRRVFVEHYLRTWNASEAARQAGYSEHSARYRGRDLLDDPAIVELIAARMQDLVASADEVKARLTRMSRINLADFVKFTPDEGTKTGNIWIDLEMARERDALDGIKKIKMRRLAKGEEVFETNIELELHDAQAATVQLGRMHGLFIDKVAPTTPDGTKPYDDLAEFKQRLLSKFSRRDDDERTLGADKQPDA